MIGRVFVSAYWASVLYFYIFVWGVIVDLYGCYFTENHNLSDDLKSYCIAISSKN